MRNKRITSGAVTPTGEPGYLIECTCGTNHGTGRAIVTKACGDVLVEHPDRIHGFVLLAHHPALSRAPQVRRNGPWAA